MNAELGRLENIIALYEEEDIKKFRKAGKVAKEVRERSRSLIKVGASLFEIAETMEDWIREKAGIAFPVNLSINEIASHYTPALKEKTQLTSKDVVNVDLGVHFEGCVADTAYCTDLSGEHGKLVEAADEAVNNAVSVLKAGVNTEKAGEEIQKTIERHGFKSVRNLSGHGVGIYNVHIEPTIPNIKTAGDDLEEGMVVAIEPFASTGLGYVREDVRTEIFSFHKDVTPRDQDARKILAFVKENYDTLPFCERWLAKVFPEFKMKIALRELLSREALRSYPALKDKPGSFVSQSEVTVLIEKDSCVIIT